MRRDRFAPSPTGRLHLGHAFSALTVWDSVRRHDGQFFLRIEDIDSERSREEHVAAIFEDLSWLGIKWPLPVMRQSQRRPVYEAALDHLCGLNVCYPCKCTRRDIRNVLSAPQEAAGAGPPAPPSQRVYPGTCRERSIRETGPNDALRLDMTKAIGVLGGPDALRRITYCEDGQKYFGRYCLDAGNLLTSHGDIVLARRDIGTSYHLSVVIDDGEQRMTHVTRGEDLFGATPLHRLLQALLGIDPPVWNHHRLIRDEAGNRLAKRNDATTLCALRRAGYSPADIRRMVGM